MIPPAELFSGRSSRRRRNTDVEVAGFSRELWLRFRVGDLRPIWAENLLAATAGDRRRPPAIAGAGEEGEGWCDSTGSVEDIQAKLLKRQEAAAKRERAIAYALTHQWQAGSRQLAATEAFEPDKNSWGWNWLERWMAVRPWENRFLDNNLKDEMLLHGNGLTDGKYELKTQFKPASKKLSFTIHSNISNTEGSGSSSRPAGKRRPRVPSEEVGEAMSKPLGLGPRSSSNPKERLVQPHFQAKNRLSLPSNTVAGAGRIAATMTGNSQKPMKTELKFGPKSKMTNVVEAKK